jgi:hypothetical protein
MRATAILFFTVAMLGLFATTGSAKDRSCGSISIPSGDLEGSYPVVSPASRLSCSKARKTLRHAVKHGADYGEDLPGSSGRSCSATTRPEVGFTLRFVVACGKKSKSGGLSRIDAALKA